MADKKNESNGAKAGAGTDSIADILRGHGVTLMSGPFLKAEEPDESAQRRFWTGATQKIKKHQLNPTADGQELSVEMEVTSADGESDTLRSYTRWIHADDSYVVFHNKPKSRFREGSSHITFGKKGKIDGNYRHDRIWGIVILHNGESYREEPREVKVSITDPSPSLTPQESFDQFLRDKSGRHKP